ncbi:MAG: protocatechuate 3,4-dioxygenase subunit alpha [Sneathiella sp.]|nr:MAG: protocatechuate 3,4-dioxygenase subunit alpha [Sneathiella sp.]
MVDLRALTTAPAASNVQEPLKESPSQTAGPYVHIGCLPNFVGITGIFAEDLTANEGDMEGENIRIQGHVFDGDGAICKDMMIESWQASASGSYEDGIWRRVPTNLETGVFTIDTIKPGTTQADGMAHAPHLNLWIVARGINLGLHTRLYFDDEGQQNNNDPVLAVIPDDRRDTLIATGKGDSYTLDIRLQGDGETVFFDI